MANEDLQEIEAMIRAHQQEDGAVVEMPAAPPAQIALSDVGDAIVEAKKKIIKKASDKMQDKKSIKRHSEAIAKISDRAIEVDAERQRLIVEKVNADNKIIAQEIKNRLIVLKAEAKRLKKEQKHLNKVQKLENKSRVKERKWDMFGKKLQKMKYDYVPNAFVLAMLLFFDGVKGFFDGLGAVSTAIVKALKWVIIGAIIFSVIMIVPITRHWFLSILQFKT